MLKKWNKDVVNFIARIDFLASNFPEYNISKFDHDYKVNVYHEICEGTTKWKEIKNTRCFTNHKESIFTVRIKYFGN